MISDLFKKNNKKNELRKSRPVSNGTRVLSSILIIVIVFANLFAPISVGWENKKVEVNKNKVEASSIKLEMNISKNDTSISVETLAYWYNGEKPTSFEKIFVNIEGTKDGKEYKDAEKVDLYEVSTTEDGVYAEKGNVKFINLDPDTTYTITAVGMQSELDPLNIKSLIMTGGLSYFWGTTIDEVTAKVKSDTIEIKTLQSGNTSFKEDEKTYVNESQESYMPVCGVKVAGVGQGSLGGCIAQGIYYLFFIPTSFIFAIAGTFFDWTFNYSVQSSSYKSTFVVQGWNIVRDFCNMFFIFVLLYIAFKTILNLGGSKTKEMIINVIVIGLLINFSLFTTRIIIDASNILARVFYNSDAIKITQTKNDLDIPNMIKKPDETGIIPLSEALINKVNPQNLILNANRINVSDPANQADGDTNKKKGGVTTGTFIVVTLLASAINVVGFIVFLTIGMIFVVRVVGLWIAMILSPIAFFSYTVPEMKSWGTVGATNWWPETLKLAFLAPVFIFFLYLILQFLEVGLGVLDTSAKGTLGFLISILVPFAFIMVLLMKAKSIAVKMAGEMGAAVAKAGSTVGGLALGAGVGLGAMAMRGTMGKLGSMADKSSWVNNMAGSNNKVASFFGNKFKDASQFVGKSSFDVRNTKLGASAASGLGADLGKGKVGGYEKDRKDHVEKKQKRAEELKVHEDEKANQDIIKKEMELQEVLNSVISDFQSIDRQLETQRQKKNDTLAGSTENLEAIAEIKRLNSLKTSIKKADGGSISDATISVGIANGDKTTAETNLAAAIASGVIADIEARTKDLEKAKKVLEGEEAILRAAQKVDSSISKKSITEMETVIIPGLKTKKEAENRRRTTNYANNVSWGDKWYHGAANREAKHNIIMGNKIENK